MMPGLQRWIVLLLLGCSLTHAQVNINQEPLTFDDPAQEKRFNALTAELRCLVCQNQNLADSDAPLAHDLRKELHGMLVSGASDEDIKQFMVARYGDFVLYRPPLKGNTLVLWLAPLGLLVGGAAMVAVFVRRQRRGTQELET
jgi:cytochrome c-type biogenesis protein CcmH